MRKQKVGAGLSAGSYRLNTAGYVGRRSDEEFLPEKRRNPGMRWVRVFEVITKSKKLGRKEVAGNVYSTNHIDVASSKRACFAHYMGY